MWLDALVSPYTVTARAALIEYLAPLVKKYKTAATYMIARRIERSEDWQLIARVCDDWPSMRRVLNEKDMGQGNWREISVNHKDIDNQVLTMLIREKYNEDDRTKKEAKNSNPGRRQAGSKTRGDGGT